jgi:hypothetical protein
MKKTTLFFVLLVTFSTILIAGCTQQIPVVTPASSPAITAVPTYVVQNQGGVAIITNQTAAVQTTLPTVTNVNNQTQAVVGNVTNQTQVVVGNVTNQTQEKK